MFIKCLQYFINHCRKFSSFKFTDILISVTTHLTYLIYQNQEKNSQQTSRIVLNNKILIIKSTLKFIFNFSMFSMILMLACKFYAMKFFPEILLHDLSAKKIIFLILFNFSFFMLFMIAALYFSLNELFKNLNEICNNFSKTKNKKYRKFIDFIIVLYYLLFFI